MRRLPLLSALLALSACAGEPDDGLNEADAKDEWAEQLCAQATSCGCETGADATACAETSSARFLDWQNEARHAQLEFDAACMQRVLDRLSSFACDAVPMRDEPCDICSVWVGGVAEGQACESDPAPFASRCAQGLNCVAGACVDLCEQGYPTLAEGELCWGDDEPLGLCGPGLYCDYVSTQRCAAAVPLGGSCAADPCDSGAYCAEDETCAPRRAEGEACENDYECETLTCRAQACVAPEALVCGYL